jgi:hypothetical protein
MSQHGNQRAVTETGANPANAAMAARAARTPRAITPDRTQAAIRSILRPPATPPRPGVRPETRAAVGQRVAHARAGERAQMRAEANPQPEASRGLRSGRRMRPSGKGGRGANPARGASHPLTAQERRAQMLERNAARPLSPDAKEIRANFQRAVWPNMRTKPETATARAIREGQNRPSRYEHMTPKERATALAGTRAVEGRQTHARYALTGREKDDYSYLKTHETQLQQEVAHYTQLAAHPPEPEDRRFGQLMAHAAQSQLNLLEGFRTRLGEGKAARAAARAAKLAPLRAHLAGLKAASREGGAAGVNDWLAQKYPQLGASLSRAYGEKPMSASVARRIAASYATLEREFPSAGARIGSLGISRTPNANGLIHSTQEGGRHSINIAPTIGQRGALKAAPRSATGKPMSVEALMRASFAPAIQSDLQAMPADSPGGKAYAKWTSQYPSGNFARSFTNIAYGRGGKGQRGEARSPEVRALKRALAVAYPAANLSQKPITPTS